MVFYCLLYERQWHNKKYETRKKDIFIFFKPTYQDVGGYVLYSMYLKFFDASGFCFIKKKNRSLTRTYLIFKSWTISRCFFLFAFLLNIVIVKKNLRENFLMDVNMSNFPNMNHCQISFLSLVNIFDFLSKMR